MSLKQTFTKKIGKRMLAGMMSAAMIMTSFGMMPAKAADEEVSISAEQIITYAVGGKVNEVNVTREKSEGNTSPANDIYYLNEIVTGDAEKNAQLVDGDTETTFKYGATRVTFIDLGADHKVSKVEVYGAQGNYCVATADTELPTEITKGTPVVYNVSAAIRLNNTEGYNISKDKLTYGDGVVTIAGVDFGRYLIIDANGSQADIAEVKAYTETEGPVVPVEPGTDVTIGDDGKIDLSTASTFAFKAGSAQDSKATSLYDGDTTTAIGTANQAFTVFDLGKSYPISKIRLQATGVRGDDFVAVSNDEIWLQGFDSSVKRDDVSVNVLRNNNIKQNGVEIISAQASEGNVNNFIEQIVGPVVPTSGSDTSGSYRFIIVYNWSYACQATELEVYVMTEEEIAAAELAKAKNVAKAELNQYLPEGKVVDSYTEENYAKIEEARTNGASAIDAAETKEAVAQALEAAKAVIDAVESIQVSDELPAYKTAAIAAVAGTIADTSVYDALAQNSINAIVKDATAKINLDTTNTVEKVDAIKEAAVTSLQSILTAEQAAAADKTQDAQVSTTAISNVGNGATIEVFTTADGSTDFAGLLSFPLESGKKVKSATLRLVAERTKDDVAIKITNFDAAWNENNIAPGSFNSYAEQDGKNVAVYDENSRYSFLKESIDKSRASDKAITQKLNSDGNWAIFDNNWQAANVDNWTTEIDVTDLIAENASEVNFLLSKPDSSQQTCIFSKEYASYADRDRYAKIQTVVENAGKDMSYLAPKLIVEYEEDTLITDVGAYYSMYLGKVQANIDAKDIVVPLYFNEITNTNYVVGGINLDVHFDADALDFKGLEVPFGSLGSQHGVSAPAVGDVINNSFAVRAALVDVFTNEETKDGVLLNLHFAPKAGVTTDNTTYDISATGVDGTVFGLDGNVVLYPDKNSPTGYSGVQGHPTIEAGSITFGTPVVEKTALEKVNEAADAAALKAVVEDAANAEELQLDLTKYNTLNEKDVVMASVLAQKPYETAEAFKTAFDAAVDAQYAVENPPVYEYALGDVNHDGTITIEDALLALQISVGVKTVEPTSWELLSADLDGNGTVDTNEVLAILQKANGKTVEGVNWLGKR